MAGARTIILSLFMPPPSDNPAFALTLLPRPFKVVQRSLSDGLDVADLALLRGDGRGRFASVTRTDEEISVVYECEADENDAKWRCIKIAGPMDFGRLLLYMALRHELNSRGRTGVTGVMCDFASPLKKAGIPIFAISTWYVSLASSLAEEQAATAHTMGPGIPTIFSYPSTRPLKLYPPSR